MSRCDQLDAILFGPDRAKGHQELAERIGGLGDVAACLLAGLTRSAQRADWHEFDRYLIVGLIQPTPIIVELLCSVLDQRIKGVSNEDILEVLSGIKDPRSIPAIERALLWNPPEDEGEHIAVKSIWALSAIGTPEALEILTNVASTGSEHLREMALSSLRFHARRS